MATNQVDQLAEKAMQAAYQGDWQSAIETNQAILKIEKQNLAALNRLAKAYLENENPNKAKETYQQVLKIDQYNSIAEKNLKKLTNYIADPKRKPTVPNPIANLIEEPGTSKTVSLVNLCEPKLLANLDAGDEVSLQPRKRQICVFTVDTEKHIGKIPEDLSQRLISLIKGGNEYQAWIKSADDNQVKIFIKEIHRSPKFSSIPSFPSDQQSNYLSFTDPEGIYEDRPDTTSTDEQD